MQNQQQLEDAVRRTYARVAERWSAEKDNLFSGQCGYGILGSPPRHQPELVIIGENPGFGAEDIGQGAHIDEAWPESSYADGDRWPLKDRLGELFAQANLTPIFRQAVVTNFLFFASGSHSRDGDLRWMSLPRSVRSPLEKFCRDELQGLLAIMEPKQIMILGMGAFSKRVSDQSLGLLARDGERWLIGTGTLWGVPAFGIMHLTGAQWASEDRARAADWLRERFEQTGETGSTNESP